MCLLLFFHVTSTISFIAKIKWRWRRRRWRGKKVWIVQLLLKPISQIDLKFGAQVAAASTHHPHRNQKSVHIFPIYAWTLFRFEKLVGRQARAQFFSLYRCVPILIHLAVYVWVCVCFKMLGKRKFWIQWFVAPYSNRPFIYT